MNRAVSIDLPGTAGPHTPLTGSSHLLGQAALFSNKKQWGKEVRITIIVKEIEIEHARVEAISAQPGCCFS